MPAPHAGQRIFDPRSDAGAAYDFPHTQDTATGPLAEFMAALAAALDAADDRGLVISNGPPHDGQATRFPAKSSLAINRFPH